ncbi:MAG: FAD-dependent oxidoreductase [Oscillatoria sp. PMC 1051.18]|nr:FAD-dependent oxidoreductase [Oscillatoria sp. PMC 1050.18]MEC5030871.1 FAD-dependent oxidoreductase [Oscillatoria sp. PMC 1051.18]
MIKVGIVGCGVVGAAIAYELSRVEGLNVTLFDRQTPASGSTGAALGVLMGAISQKTKGRGWRLRSASMRRYDSLIAELREITGQDFPYNQQGILLLRFAEDDRDRWEKLIEVRKAQGWKLELCDRLSLQEKCPQLQNDRIVGAVYSPQDRQVDPTALTQALVTAARINGVNCNFGLEVQNFATTTVTGSNELLCQEIYTTGGAFEIDWLVISAGLGSLPLTTSLSQKVDIRPVLGQALHVKSKQPLGNPNFQPVITGDDVHIVPLGNQEYWLGATVEFPDDTGEINADSALLAQVKKQAISFCPALANATILRTWSGKRPRPEGQSAPVISKLTGYRNVLLATGHYRNGILLAPATALQIKETILKNQENC